MASAAGGSGAECALKCELQFVRCCSAAAFVSETKTCIFSAEGNADFSSLVPGGSVYRKDKRRPDAGTFRLVQADGRTFQVIQHRSKGCLSFARGWVEYVRGFSDDTDFWTGLHKIHQLTGSSPKTLRVEATTWSDVLYVGEYSGFSVGSAINSYTMNYGSYLSSSSNMTSDSLAHNNGMQFSTMDRDNDGHSASCSVSRGNAGWWFKACSRSNPNGLYRDTASTDMHSVYWTGATSGSNEALKSIRLMLQLA
ncbi:hypothetical protein BOX15_Mlig010952g1 [Macrostomum lignano]|uniref:Fibrinogen C-terminal domain-containing protein n=2 Tax=Macrostomum lignano TaxID=282301 RepID=A0A267E584_9PLAT|nr:hypothetical protein BOX15_Mlig010952g1 [Macrostomum lignano]